MEDNKGQKTFLEKLPYGIISGACAMFVFFATVALIAVYIVFSGIAGQTGDTVSFFEDWWQVLLFVFDIIFLVIAVASLVMFILKKTGAFSGDAVASGENN